MSVTAEKTVRQWAVENPCAARIFEKLALDYCCGGNKSLADACDAANLSTDAVLKSLEADSPEMKESRARSAPPVSDWKAEPLSELIYHIKSTHHKYTREELARVAPLLNKVCSVHGKNHPELEQVRANFQALAAELTVHMMKEENVLFPYIVRMEESVIEREPVVPAPFGSVRNPVSMLEHEHDSAGNALQAMRAASSGYTPPPDACISYRTLYEALTELEADLHQHIHLENNILFPRAIAIEQAH